MHVHVLGSAAGGGFPQWNCNCPQCAGVRRHTIRAQPRTQSSIAVSGDGVRWLLCDASPDILTQLRGFDAAQPARAVRDTGLAAVLLTDAQIDHTTGLYMLREHGARLNVWCTAPVHDDLLHHHRVFKLLDYFCGVDWHPVPVDGSWFTIDGVAGLRFRALPIVSNAPPYSPRRDHPVPGDNIGLLMADESNGKSLFYAPGLAEMGGPTDAAMRGADCVMVDGTCWRDDEMIALGVSKKTARDMGHRALSGENGVLRLLGSLRSDTRKVLIHINNTNPVLDEDGPEYAQVRAAGVELAHDGMDFVV